jgi:hypothetical protein
MRDRVLGPGKRAWQDCSYREVSRVCRDRTQLHTHASHMLAARILPKVVQEQQGSFSIAVTHAGRSRGGG